MLHRFSQTACDLCCLNGNGHMFGSLLFSPACQYILPLTKDTKGGRHYKRSVCFLNIHTLLRSSSFNLWVRKTFCIFFCVSLIGLFVTLVQMNPLQLRKQVDVYNCKPLCITLINLFAIKICSTREYRWNYMSQTYYSRVRRFTQLSGVLQYYVPSLSTVRNKSSYLCIWRKLRTLPLTLSSLLNSLVSTKALRWLSSMTFTHSTLYKDPPSCSVAVWSQ